MRGIFVTGTDTGVGKTVIVGLLARYLSEKGLNVVTQKWIQTGSSSFGSSDVMTHLEIAGLDRKKLQKYFNQMLPCVFRTPCSPHLASQTEKRKVNLGKIKKSFRQLSREFDFVIVEGVGGTLVPFDKKSLVIDIAKKIDLPVLIVALNKLGAINHTLLTIEALRAREFKILGIIFNNVRNEGKFILKDNPGIIRAISEERILGILPRGENLDELHKNFSPIGDRITKLIKPQDRFRTSIRRAGARL